MTTAISANAHTAVQPKPFPARPLPSSAAVQTAPERTPPAAPAQVTAPSAIEDEEIEHPFADIGPQYEGETILKSEAEKIWDSDQSKDLFGKDGFGFDDFLDIINPLQHIPVVSTIYRALTDDQIEPGARLAGGALFGGGIGFAGALVNAVIENDTGKDIGDHALAMVGLSSESGGAPAQLAAAQSNAQTATDKPLSAKAGQSYNKPGIAAVIAQDADRRRAGSAPVVPVQSQRGRAFGGIMNPPNGTPTAATAHSPIAPNLPKSPQSQAVDALLQARTAVPGHNKQTVAGAAASGRFAPGAGPKPDAARAAAAVVNPKDPVTLSPTMAAKLSALSRKTQSAGTTPAKTVPNGPATPFDATPHKRAQQPNSNLGPGKFQNAAAPLPNIMLDALDKYELMVRERQKKRT